jgi:hypothetical protein
VTDVGRFQADVERRLTKVMRGVTFDLWNRVTRKNPVLTGRSRAAWNVAINRADTSVPPEGEYKYPSPPAIGGIRHTDTIVLSNNLPYIKRLEEGHSGQAPSGFVRISVEETKLAFRGIVAEARR